jgi:WD40 repeat protein
MAAGIVCPKGTATRNIISTGWDRKLTFFEDSRGKVVASSRQVPERAPAHDSDILACALMEDSPNLVTAASTGELRIWNIESGSLRSSLRSPGLDTLPVHRRAVEALAFVCGLPRLRHVCAAVGHDQVVRFWDVKHCRLLYQFFSGAYTAFGMRQALLKALAQPGLGLGPAECILLATFKVLFAPLHAELPAPL